MKTTKKKTSYTANWDEFIDYLTNVYWTGAEDDLEPEQLTFEYQQYCGTMA